MNAQRQPEYGYWYCPPQSEGAPAGNRLEVILFAKPTGQHFDPHFVNLLVNSGDLVETVRFHHPWGFGDEYQVCPGRVEMVDWAGKEEEAFTFGGHFSLEEHDDWTRGVLESPAPILAISDVDPIKRLWIEEVEILLAERRAAFVGDPIQFERRLANAKPFDLYVACLNAISQKFKAMHHLQEPQILELLQLIQTEKRRLKGESVLPLVHPVLEEIL